MVKCINIELVFLILKMSTCHYLYTRSIVIVNIIVHLFGYEMSEKLSKIFIGYNSLRLECEMPIRSYDCIGLYIFVYGFFL